MVIGLRTSQPVVSCLLYPSIQSEFRENHVMAED